MNCKYLGSASCEMLKTLEEFDKNYIGDVLFTVKKGLCETDKHETCDVYKLKESLAEKK